MKCESLTLSAGRLRGSRAVVIVARVIASLRHRDGWVVLAVALVVRAVFLVQSADSPTFTTPIVDAATYHDLARGLAAGKPIGEGFFWQPFFYPFILGLLYTFTGPSILTARVFQLLLGSITCLLTWGLARRLFGPRAGLVAGLGAALCLPMVLYEADLVAAGWAAFWSVALLHLLVTVADRPRAALVFATGLLGALAALTRPTFLPFWAASAAWLAWRWRGAGRHAPARLALLAAGFAVAALPVALLNLRVTGHFGILPCSGGLNLYIGNNPDVCRTVNIRPGADWDTLTSEPARAGILETWAQDRYFHARVRAFAQEQPLAYAAGLARKALQFASSRELPRNEDPYVFRSWSSVLAALLWKTGTFGFPFGLIFPLACVGLYAHARRLPAPIWLFVLLYPLAVILVFVSARYRVPTLPVFLMLAAAGGVWLAERRRQPAAFGFLVPGTVALVALNLGLIGPFCEERVNYRSELYHFIGATKFRNGDRNGARADVQAAVELDPSNAEALHTLGVILSDGGDTNAAARTFEGVLARRPDHPDALFHLASLRYEEGRYADAARLFAGALPLRPRVADLRHKYGVSLAQLGSPADAAEQFQQALALDATLPDVHFNLGLALLDLDRAAEALPHLRREVELEPGDAAAWVVLGQALARAGDRAGAARAFREAQRLQPTWPEPLDGLRNLDVPGTE